MHRTLYPFSVLQAIAAMVGLAILLWSVGLPSLRFAEAANVTSFSDTLSDSDSGVVANHTISFVTPSGMVAGEIISITFPTGFTGIGSLSNEDFDLTINGIDQTVATTSSGATWGVTAAGLVVDFESGTTAIGAGDTVVIEIGTNATFGGGGNSQITNPGVTGSYEIDLEVGTTNDTGSTRVAIVDDVTVTASVDTLFTFQVDGVGGEVEITPNATTTGESFATSIPFGQLTADAPSTTAQTLTVNTNAANGFVVTVQVDQQLLSANGAVIDGFRDGNYDTIPVPWQPPGATPGQENEYGHWGLSSSDTTLTAGLTDLYSLGADFVSASTTPVEVFRHDGPTDGSVLGEGYADVIYQVEITALQEAADDYTATFIYVATPVF